MQKLVECTHCQGARICKADHGRSCEICRTAVGMGRKGRPTPVRCSFCTGHGRIWMEVTEEPEIAAEATAEVPEAASGPAIEPPDEA